MKRKGPGRPKLPGDHLLRQIFVSKKSWGLFRKKCDEAGISASSALRVLVDGVNRGTVKIIVDAKGEVKVKK